ncbi:hypothetical protein MSAN_01429000 [Mycena sanguinolenta]|uniref:DUF6699 domain-containing protein n=1 Tax=Mycena sanguinolenta TaxID=230812 RepID=A0A8H7CYD2_9AGAR|nr:hypothetical protein MSAN_01429000 [Mycena sanguinolenta]
MHRPYQSTTPVPSPLGHPSAKLSHRSPPPIAWTHLHPLPTTPIPYAPLPARGPPSTVIFAEDQLKDRSLGINQSVGPLGYGPYAPALPTIPLPYDNTSPHSSSRSIHSSRSSSSSNPRPLLHPLLSSLSIQYLISSSPPLSQGLLRVPQDLQNHNINIDAFYPEQNRIQIQITANPADNIVIESQHSLTVAFILQSLHFRLHSPLPRVQFTGLSPQDQTTAQMSYHARCQKKGRGETMKILDILGFGNKDMIFVGLQKGNGIGEWIPVFQERA